MSLISILLMIIFVASSLLLVLLVMLQDESGEGLGGIFGGGAASQIGSRRGNILTKITGILGALFMLGSFGLAWFNRTPDTSDVEAAARRLESTDQVEWWILEEDTESENE